ncbi:MAG: hypothetical protein Q9166_007523 [cf. Caloplaca sp. 2 TL-2023]
MSLVSSLGSVTLRSEQCLPEHCEGKDTISTNPDHLIEFKHPAYPDDCDTFLILYALDHPDGGLHCDTAKVACGIIAGNNWHGYFTAEKGGPPNEISGDDILPCGKWYFYIPGYRYDSIDTAYPITPHFAAWKFPHDDLPSNWLFPRDLPRRNSQIIRSDASVALAIRDGGQCRVSGRKEKCTKAHIIPVDEDDWYHLNQMSKYVHNPQRRSRSAITDLSNLILLRADLHRSFDDDKKFVFVPKKPQPNLSNMVTHLLSPSDEFGLLYHNTAAYSLDLVPRQYLFARFAWAIFPLIEPFLLSNVKRFLATATKGQHTFNPDECKEFTVPRGRRSGTGSPKKRARTTDTMEEPTQEEYLDQERGCDINKRLTKRRKLSSEPIFGNNKPAVPTLLGKSSADVHALPTPTRDTKDTTPQASVTPSDSSSTAATEQPNIIVPSPELLRQRFNDLRERALNKERLKSDPDSSHEEEFEWAMDIIRNQHSANDIQAWADVDEAERILGMIDDDRDWVKYEDRYGSLV